MMKKILGKYRNGNYSVCLFNDGTKIRKTDDDEFCPDFAESIDLKITDKCTGANCAWCHEGSSPGGRHGNIMGERFVDTLKPWQEVAIGGGNVLEHPSLIPFLRKLKMRNIIANVTIHQTHFEANQEIINQIVDEKLVYGLEISLINPTDKFIEMVKEYPNAVIHVIHGIVQGSQLNKLRNQGLKLLILGYKQLRRGSVYFEREEHLIHQRMDWLYENLPELIHDFKVISFDNLAIEQLQVKRLLSDEDWDAFYMGNEAAFTFYIDMVNRTFAKSSMEPLDTRYDLLDDVVDMFNKVRNNNHVEQSQYVYCTCCRHFTVTENEAPECKYRNVCNLYDPEDSRPYIERPYYEQI